MNKKHVIIAFVLGIGAGLAISEGMAYCREKKAAKKAAAESKSKTKLENANEPLPNKEKVAK